MIVILQIPNLQPTSMADGSAEVTKTLIRIPQF